MQPISRYLIQEWRDSYDKTNKLKLQIEERARDIINALAEALQIKIDDWYFFTIDMNKGCGSRVFEEEGIINFVALLDNNEVAIKYPIKENGKTKELDRCFPTSWLFDDFNQELEFIKANRKPKDQRAIFDKIRSKLTKEQVKSFKDALRGK